VLGELGIGCIVFSALAQGMVTDRYLHGDLRGLAREPPRLPLAGPAGRGDAREDPRSGLASVGSHD
jgi:aryl-alcohol dehydrogenase-like predicted oxidoreductase